MRNRPSRIGRARQIGLFITTVWLATTLGAWADVCPNATEYSSSIRPEQIERAEAAIQRTLDRWERAVREGDPETLGQLVTKDAEFWTQQSPPLTGRERVVEAFERFFERYDVEQAFDCQEFILTAEWAFFRGTEINTLTPLEGGPETVRRQRAFSVLRRNDDGEWLFARGMTHLPPEPDS